MPTLVSSWLLSQATSGGGTVTTPSFTPLQGDWIVVKAISEDSVSSAIGTPAGGGWTYTAAVSDTTASRVAAAIYRAQVTSASPPPQTVSVTFTGTGGRGDVIVALWRNAAFAASPATCDARGSGAPSTALTTVAAGSVVSWANGDWAAVDGTSRAYVTTSATPAEDGYHLNTGADTAYFAHQAAASAGAQTLGLTAPAGQTWTLLGIEIQDAGGGAAVIAPAATPQQRTRRQFRGRRRRRQTPTVITSPQPFEGWGMPL